MTKQFIIFKEGVTDHPVTILSQPKIPFDKAKKICFYTSLGYTVSSIVSQMKYVVQCYISDKTGETVRISEFTEDQLNAAYQKACAFYGPVLPAPDNGRYEDYTL